ncbi:MAG: hypothetical protein HZC37_19350 [Burkholderiales bacterium]|nr:hypothetical protein [Burkholderiales bacterium]
MGALTLLLLIVAGFLAGLVTLAALVAGWEWLRQREALEMLRRDRATFAATSPLPLAAAAAPRAAGEGSRPQAVEPGAGAPVPASPPPAQRGVPPLRREPSWIETRPMVLSYVPAVDDETIVRHREPDLRLD